MGKQNYEKIRSSNMDRLMELMGQGKKRYQIQEILQKELKLAESTIDHWIQEARGIIANSFSTEQLHQQYQHLYDIAYAQKNYAECRKINDSVAKLKIDGFGTNKVVINVRFDGDEEENE